MDSLTPERRSWQMAQVRSKNTKPELAIRRLLHRLGYRFRLHGAGLPGKPDIVFSGRKKAIFVHGCFWHGHPGCKYARMPRSRLEYWGPKIANNQARDARTSSLLVEQDWQSIVIWECEIKDLDSVAEKLVKFLGSTKFPDPNRGA